MTSHTISVTRLNPAHISNQLREISHGRTLDYSPTMRDYSPTMRERTRSRRCAYPLVMLGDLVQTTDGKWMTRPPSRCPNDHPLGANQVLVGHQACLGHGGGHTTWTCRAWDQTVFGPPLNIHCTALDGPATVRISTARN
jgi:hypothetical protein